jgi:tetratricopeptide (TPR) repeat protein
MKLEIQVVSFKFISVIVPLIIVIIFSGCTYGVLAFNSIIYDKYSDYEVFYPEGVEVFEEDLVVDNEIENILLESISSEEVVVNSGSDEAPEKEFAIDMEEVVDIPVVKEIEKPDPVEKKKVVEKKIAPVVVDIPEVAEVVIKEEIVEEVFPTPIVQVNIKRPVVRSDISKIKPVVIKVEESEELVDIEEVSYDDYALAKRLFNSKSYKDALPYFKWEAEFNPTNLEARTKLRSIYKILDLKADLESFYLDLIKKYPNRAMYHVSLGTLYMAEFWDFDRAEISYNKALELDPSNEAAKYNLRLISDYKK